MSEWEEYRIAGDGLGDRKVSRKQPEIIKDNCEKTNNSFFEANRAHRALLVFK